MNHQNLQASSLKQMWKFKKHRAELYEYNGRDGFIYYFYVVAVIPKDKLAAVMFITTEATISAMQANRPPFLCVYGSSFGSGRGHQNYGNSVDWIDIRTFGDRAREIICQRMDETKIPESWWKRLWNKKS